MSFPKHKGRLGLVGGSLPKNNLSKLFLILKGGSGSGNFGHSGRPGKRGGSSSKGNLSDSFSDIGIKLVNRGVEESVADRTSSLALNTIKSLKKYKLFQRVPEESKNIITGEIEPDFNKLVIDQKGSGGWDANSGTLSIGFPPYIKMNQIQGDSKELNVFNSGSNWTEGIKNKDVRVYVPTIIRHEMGHYAQDRLLNNEEKSKWKEVYSNNKSGLHDTFKDDYYSGKQSESFAESLAFVTHKGYKKGTLPPDVESFMFEILNK